jgi:phospho-N-acetylmuramoyl-pentapeptide-transferase
MTFFILGCAVALVCAALLTPLVARAGRKLKMGQAILSYVDNHSTKAGTPTFGGVAFLAACSVSTVAFSFGARRLAIMCLVVSAAFGIVGFTDDLIKTVKKDNQGLTALQKIVFQAFISVIVATFAYADPTVGSKIILPFTLQKFDLGYFSIPFYVFVFLAFTNSVNLTDGLDGLASKTSAVYLIVFAVLTYFAYAVCGYGDEYYNLSKFAAFLAFATSGFLVFNSYPALIFMGDTGSLALGGAIGALATLSGMSLYAPIVGIVFVITALSDVIQVAWYKRTKKRVFLMAPLHHHFERKGFHENKITSFYTFITAVAGLVCIIITAAVLGV